MDRAKGRAGQGDLGLGDGPCDPEIHDLDLPVASDEDVSRLDITVHDPTGMGGRQRTRDASRDAGRLTRREGSTPAQDRRQILAVHELHDDERTGRILTVVVDDNDVGVTQRRRGLGFLAKP